MGSIISGKLKKNQDGLLYSISSSLSRYRFRRVIYIASFWTFIDIIGCLLEQSVSGVPLLIRTILVFVMSFIIGYLFIFALRDLLRQKSLWMNFVAKTFILLLVALFMNFLVHFVQDLFVGRLTVMQSVHKFYLENLRPRWLIARTLYWVILLLVTQLYIEINDKYSPGVFTDILMGKYIIPKIENRIVMFIDLKDSTPIAEKLGHEKNFLFIREFIFNVSLAIIEYNGIIYQYVGDEVVVSWSYNRKNMKSCLDAVIKARRNIQRNSEHFRRKFGIVPEFRVGIHVGEVTIGEIGVIKKDLAMSGDTMNTAARIKGACNDLNQSFIASGQFIEKGNLKYFQSESLGMVELKGKANELELFSIKI